MNNISTERISLGTAQFGLNYGIANENGIIAKREAFRILEYANESGIDCLDTAYAYGDSEDVIGEFLSKTKTQFKIVSKLPDIENGNASSVGKYFAETSKRLRTPRLYGYLLHKFDNILAEEALWPAMESIRERGLAEKVGVSLYRPSELEYILERGMKIDIVQIPYNILDQRFEEHLPVLHKRGIEVHTRSVFLQGLFFLDEERIKRKFDRARHIIAEIRRIAVESDIPIQALCLCFAVFNPLIDKIVIGVDSLAHLKEDVASLRRIPKVEKIYDRLKSLQFHDENVILPYKWQ